MDGLQKLIYWVALKGCETLLGDCRLVATMSRTEPLILGAVLVHTQ